VVALWLHGFDRTHCIYIYIDIHVNTTTSWKIERRISRAHIIKNLWLLWFRSYALYKYISIQQPFKKSSAGYRARTCSILSCCYGLVRTHCIYIYIYIHVNTTTSWKIERMISRTHIFKKLWLLWFRSYALYKYMSIQPPFEKYSARYPAPTMSKIIFSRKKLAGVLSFRIMQDVR